MLRLVESTEQADPEAHELALDQVSGVSAEFLGNCLAQALSWANNLGREQGAEEAKPGEL